MTYGNTTNIYYPIVCKEEYCKKVVNDILADFFQNSPVNMVGSIAEEGKIRADELKTISISN